MSNTEKKADSENVNKIGLPDNPMMPIIIPSMFLGAGSVFGVGSTIGACLSIFARRSKNKKSEKKTETPSEES